jgi:hypothetical protein
MTVDAMPAAALLEKKAETSNGKKKSKKDLTKTRLCTYYTQRGSCQFGSECIFAHHASELRSAPNLAKTQICQKFIEGKCDDTECRFAHGEEELRERQSFKKKACTWFSKGLCRNGESCGFAHGSQELRAEPFADSPSVSAEIAPPPGLSLDEEEVESPEKSYFSFMAGRGAAPLEDQVKSMSCVLAGLQDKLTRLEGMMMQSQVSQMQQSIMELSEQCWHLQSSVSAKSCLNAKAVPFVPCTDWGSDDSTSIGSD